MSPGGAQPGARPARALSVFFPMYNEAENARETVRRSLEALPRLADEFEVILVNDGSRDGTGTIADELARADARVRAVHHEVNRGYGAALKSGLAAARHELVFFTDGDLQFDLNEIELLLAQLDGADVVVGYRIDRKDPLQRKLNGILWTRLTQLVLGLRIRDVNCAFKLFRKSALARCGELEAEGAMLSAELMARLQRSGARIKEVGVHHYPRSAGQQTGAKPGVILKAFKELLALRSKLRQRS